MSSPSFHLKCVICSDTYVADQVRYRCDCGGTLDVQHDFSKEAAGITLQTLDARLGSKNPLDLSGVWRFRELVLPIPEANVVTKPEGRTNLYHAPSLDHFVGLQNFRLKHEGENPTGSFKDRGMTVGVSMAKRLGMTQVACASTGNTSASLAAYAAQAGMRAIVFLPEGQIAYGKLSQALAFGAVTIQISGDFDAAMKLVEEVCAGEGIYLLNSVNPYRIEGQKSIGFDLLQQLDWQVPDWLVLPGGNLGNSAAIGKGLQELLELGLIPKLPRIAVIQAAGANPFYEAFQQGHVLQAMTAKTLATAIKIGNPLSWQKSLRGVTASGGTVAQVTDQEIMDAKAHVDAAGIGAEPASCATVAGTRKLVAEGLIEPQHRVCGILTGHILKDPDAVVEYHQERQAGIQSTHANRPLQGSSNSAEILRLLRQPSGS